MYRMQEFTNQLILYNKGCFPRVGDLHLVEKNLLQVKFFGFKENTKQLEIVFGFPNREKMLKTSRCLDYWNSPNQKRVQEIKKIQKSLLKNAEVFGKMPRKNEIYKHYKGDNYKVKEIIFREESETLEVAYFLEKDGENGYYWLRELNEWNSMVNVVNQDEKEGQVKRFTLLAPL